MIFILPFNPDFLRFKFTHRLFTLVVCIFHFKHKYTDFSIYMCLFDLEKGKHTYLEVR